MIPTRLKLKNFQSYGEADLDLDFSSALIVGERDSNLEVSNGSGKSSIFEGLVWALFGKCKQKTADSVVRRGADECRVDLWFKELDKEYHVSRKRNSKFGKAEVQLFEVENGSESQLDSDTKKDVDLKIRELVKTNYESFIASSYFQQRAITELLTGTPATRQKMLAGLINLERWDAFAESAKSKAAEFVDSINKTQGKLSVYAEAKPEALPELQNQLSVSAHGLVNLAAQEQTLRRRLAEVGAYKGTDATLAESKTARASVQELLEETELDLAKVQHSHSVLLEDLRRYDEQLKNPPTSDVKQLVQNVEGQKLKLNTVITKISMFNPDEICACCGKAKSEHHLEMQKYLDAKERAKVAEEQLATLQKYLEEQLSVHRQHNGFLALKSMAEKSIQQVEVTLKRGQEQFASLTSRLSQYDVRINELEQQLSTESEDAKQLNRVAEEQLALLLLQKEKSTVEHNQLESKLTSLRAAIKEKAKHEQELTQLEESLALYKTLTTIFGRKGIQAVLLDNLVDDLVASTNHWLNEFCYDPCYIKILTQKPDSKGVLKDTFEIELHSSTGQTDFDSLSGGEAFRVAFAIRLALADLQAKKLGFRNDLLLLDEVSSALDRQGLDTFIGIIRQLEKKLKVLVITHDDNLKEAFEDIIQVRRAGLISTANKL